VPYQDVVDIPDLPISNNINLSVRSNYPKINPKKSNQTKSKKFVLIQFTYRSIHRSLDVGGSSMKEGVGEHPVHYNLSPITYHLSPPHLSATNSFTFAIYNERRLSL